MTDPIFNTMNRFRVNQREAMRILDFLSGDAKEFRQYTQKRSDTFQVCLGVNIGFAGKHAFVIRTYPHESNPYQVYNGTNYRLISTHANYTGLVETLDSKFFKKRLEQSQVSIYQETYERTYSAIRAAITGRKVPKYRFYIERVVGSFQASPTDGKSPFIAALYSFCDEYHIAAYVVHDECERWLA